mmetsp:Transcript_78147/g.176629  ORF Transcript_78147/g.176629 Transcript_78147/m.176629 type:complete len:139 (-) Transcript_78147:117-533(-)
MGTAPFRSPRPAQQPAVPVFYSDSYFREYGNADPAASAAAQESVAVEPPPPPPPQPVSVDELKATERNRILAELREQELSTAEAAAQRIGRWAVELQSRTVPCLGEQAEVERCYAAPPGGDQLRCAPAVDAFVRCAKL